MNNSDLDINQFISIIHSETGIDSSTMGEYSYISAIKKCMQESGIEEHSEYLQLIKSSRQEMSRLIEEIIVPETWFFRDEFAFDALIAELNKKKNNLMGTPLRILSLPSSTGEEAYSIAIKLFENNYTSDMFQIDAIDISQRNIDSANQGSYRQHSFRKNLPQHIMEKYFVQNEDLHLITDKVKEVVSFKQGNLFDANNLHVTSYYDAIFCRNLLIYFNLHEKKKAVNKLSAALKDNGIFLIGHSETSIIPTEHYKPCGIIRSFGFIKSNQPIKRKKTSLPKKSASFNKSSPKKVNLSKPSVNKKIAAIKTEKTVVQDVIVTESISLEEAKLLADRNQFTDALNILEKLANTDHSADYFTLMGTIHNTLNNTTEAEKAFRKALFLAPEHEEALIHLALLLEKKGDIKNSQLLKRRVEKHHLKA